MAAKGSTGEMFRALAQEPRTGVAQTAENPAEVRAQQAATVPGILAGREGAIWDVSSGKRVTRVVRRVDPERCRVWTRHNRRYDLLSAESCADLIEGFRQQGGQEFPAIVRRVNDSSSFDYEVISGARRHWTARFLKCDFLIEERDLSDLEAFRLSDVENRHRTDLSDYERAADYLQALDLYYEGSQKQMAMNLERSEGWLSRYLDLARLDPVILEAVRDVRELTVNQARVIKPLLTGKNRTAVFDTVRECTARDVKYSAQELCRILTNVTAETKAVRGSTTLATAASRATGKVFVVARRHGRGGLLIQIDGRSGAGKDEVLDALKDLVERHYAPVNQ